MAHRKRHYIRDAIGRFARVAGKLARYARRKIRQDVRDIKRVRRGVRRVARASRKIARTWVAVRAIEIEPPRPRVTRPHDDPLLPLLLAASPDDVDRAMAQARRILVVRRHAAQKRPATRKASRR